MTGTLREDLCTVMIIYRWILLTMRYVSDENFRNTETHFIFNNVISESRSLYEIMWKNIVQLERSKMTVEHEACALCAG